MAGKRVRGLLIASAGLTVAACASYPAEPRYSTRVDEGAYAAYPAQPAPGQAVTPAEPAESAPPLTAPVGSIEGGALPSAGGTERSAYSDLPSTPAPAPAPRPTTPRPATPLPAAGSAYVIQPGDTLSGVGRRFRTPVQTLIDLNGLGPQGAIRSGQSILLPASAVDIGSDPYATGPAPTPASGSAATARPATPAPAPRPVQTPVTSATPPQTPAAPPPATTRPATPTPTPAPAPTTGTPAFQWPVRGEIVRRFGPVGLGERNHGINIAAPAGTSVVAASGGQAAYVGSALPGLGLTVIIMHRDGWRTVYSHLGSATVDDGDNVRAGQQIGTVGNTAGDGRPSVHFETRRMQGDNPTAVDPLTVLPR